MNDDSRGASDSRHAWNFNATAGVVTIAAGILLYLLIPYQVERPMTVFGQAPSGLDPDLWPTMVAIFFVAMGGWLVWRSRTLHERNDLLTLDREAILSVSVTIAAFFLYALLIVPLGFVVASALLVFGLSVFYGNRSYLVCAGFAIGVPLLLFNVFTQGLRVFLPEFPYLDVNWI